MLKRNIFAVFIVSLAIFFTSNAIGQEKKRTIAKPKKSNIFLEGGNDSWNTRKKPTGKQKIKKKSKVKGVWGDPHVDERKKLNRKFNGSRTDHSWGERQKKSAAKRKRNK